MKVKKRIKNDNKRLDVIKKKTKGKGQGHPAYIYQRIGNEYRFIGITHSDITDGVKNIKLDKNPNSNDKRDSHFLPYPSQESTGNFGRKLKGYKLSDSDKKKANEIKKRPIKK